MLDVALLADSGPPTVQKRRRQDRLNFGLAYAGCILGSLLIGAIAIATVPRPFSLVGLILVMALVVAVARPVFGVYLLVLFTALGDLSIWDWYPFTSSFSSTFSVLYIAHGLIFSPLELFLAALLIGWFFGMLRKRTWVLWRGALLRPLLVFTGFILLGFVWGMARGGNMNVALWELRRFLYLAIAYVLITNLFKRQEQYERLYWCVMVAVVINALFAYQTLEGLTAAERLTLDSLVSHGATLPMNALFIMVLGAWLFRNGSWVKRLLLPIMGVPVFIVYLASDRRSAIVGLLGAIAMLFIVLFWTRRRAFWRVVPPILLLGVVYVGAFWNNTTETGGPAQAVKAVIAPGQVSKNDQLSDMYRRIENADIVFTIKANRLLGVGFGKPFLRPYPLPAITNFLLADYMPHNSLMWIWLKSGVFGFVAMLYLFGATMRQGARAILATANTPTGAMTITSVGFVLVFLIFSYVDISWDVQNMVLLGMAMAQIDTVVGLRSGPRRRRHDAVSEPLVEGDPPSQGELAVALDVSPVVADPRRQPAATSRA